jgi:hypothetical protein
MAGHDSSPVRSWRINRDAHLVANRHIVNTVILMNIIRPLKGVLQAIISRSGDYLIQYTTLSRIQFRRSILRQVEMRLTQRLAGNLTQLPPS